MKDGNDRRKILVVDDEKTVRQLASRMLKGKYDVVEAQDGAEALNLAVRNQPDAILMDIMMPRMDGFSACYAIKNNPSTQQIPVIMVTALDSCGNRNMAEQVWKADGYISKPFDSKGLVKAIEDSLAPAGAG